MLTGQQGGFGERVVHIVRGGHHHQIDIIGLNELFRTFHRYSPRVSMPQYLLLFRPPGRNTVQPQAIHRGDDRGMEYLAGHTEADQSYIDYVIHNTQIRFTYGLAPRCPTAAWQR